MHELGKHYKIVSGVYSQEIDGEVILLDSNGEMYFRLNDVGTRIWQLLSDSKDKNEIIDILINEYAVEKEQLITDLNKLIDKLVSLKIIYVQY